MKERPINLRADEVRSIKDGSKTQIRSVFKYSEHPAVIGYEPNGTHGWWKGVAKSEALIQQYISTFPLTIKCPFGIVGDRLWVRETFAIYGDKEYHTIHYRANHPQHEGQKGMGYKPSTNMPRWASRILLEITNIRVERLQDISEEDATAEGMVADDDYCAEQYYSIFWNKKHGWKEKGWNANPWVWVIEFKVIQGGES